MPDKGSKWMENEWIVAREVYDVVGAEPPKRENNKLIRHVANKTGRSPDTIFMRMGNFASRDLVAKKRNNKKYLSGKRTGEDDAALIDFYWRMKIDHPKVFQRKLVKAVKSYGIDILE